MDQRRQDLVRNNVVSFVDACETSAQTKTNVLGFLDFLCEIDPQHLTQFELSFKLKQDFQNIHCVRLLNLDSKAYSYKNPQEYQKRLNHYFDFLGPKISNAFKQPLYQALEILVSNPLDLYFGADICEEEYLFAFWMIFGGAQKDGTIRFDRNSNELVRRMFDSLEIKPSFEINRDIINVGFDIDQSHLFYKIYYFLTRKNYQSVSPSERKRVKDIINLLGSRPDYWFFLSERYDTADNQLVRKKLYLEFLGDHLTTDSQTYVLLKKLFRILGCTFPIARLQQMLERLTARIVILAFEPEGNITFYVRI